MAICRVFQIQSHIGKTLPKCNNVQESFSLCQSKCLEIIFPNNYNINKNNNCLPYFFGVRQNSKKCETKCLATMHLIWKTWYLIIIWIYVLNRNIETNQKINKIYLFSCISSVIFSQKALDKQLGIDECSPLLEQYVAVCVNEENLSSPTIYTHQMTEAVNRALWSLNGVSIGSPRRKLAIKLPAKQRSMEETQQDRGCFLEKTVPPTKTQESL